MKKILIVNDGFPPHSWGGSSTISYLQAMKLKKEGFDVKVFTTTQDRKQKTGWSEYQGLAIYTFYTNYHYRWWAYKSLSNREITAEFKRELTAYKPDVVHFHTIHNYFSYNTIAIAKGSGAKVFFTAHDVMSFAYQKLHHFIDYSSKTIPTHFNYHVPWRVNLKDARLRFNPLRNFIIRGYLKQADQIFAVSDALKQALEDNGIKGNVSVVHNGIDAASSTKPFDEEGLRRELGLNGSKIILFVGRFTPDKGRDVLLKALARVQGSVPSAKLLVVGMNYAETEPGLSHLLNSLDLQDCVVFAPPVPNIDIYKYYRIADCVVVPSVIFDSFPTVNLEAAAAKKPVIATCFGGSCEAVEDGVTGFIINPLDIDLFAQKMTLLLSDASKAQEMGNAAHERVKKEFSLEQQLKNYAQFY